MSKETAKSLNFIDKASVVEEKGAPAYAIIGNVEVKDVIHAPLDEADKNLPSEAPQKLVPRGTGRVRRGLKDISFPSDHASQECLFTFMKLGGISKLEFSCRLLCRRPPDRSFGQAPDW
jgi:hypothetical protein